MSIGQDNAWLLPGHLRPPDDRHEGPTTVNGVTKGLSRSRTPLSRSRASADELQAGNATGVDTDVAPEEDPRVAIFRESYERTEAKIGALFDAGKSSEATPDWGADAQPQVASLEHGAAQVQADLPPPSKRPARKFDDEDYDEYDEEDDNEVAPQAAVSKKEQATKPTDLNALQKFPASSGASKLAKKESAEETRRKLEEDRKTTEEAARRSCYTMFFTLENDRDAMMDQKRLEESERQVEEEMSGQGGSNGNAQNGPNSGYGPLSSANLGASSLTLKNLIARIDMKRNAVQASDAELRSLMSEVRKNRSKWANEDKVGQEELYEAAEKVLSELKAMTEHSGPFLTRVNKRDAPDYYHVIKHPMDLGTMTKKLKGIQYKSKQEFVDDLSLIWANCLKYNANPEHFLRKHALYMRKETEKLVPLIPDIVIRDRAEVEAEERKLQMADLDGGEESDDEPIMSSRGRAAPGTKSKKGIGAGRTSTGPAHENTSVGDQRIQALARADSVAPESGQNGQSTPPPGSITPHAPAIPDGDVLEIDSFGLSMPRSNQSKPIIDFEDPEYRIWKQATKKGRAHVAAERHRLFNGNKLNPDEPALLRTKSGMKRWLRSHRPPSEENNKLAVSGVLKKPLESTGETLAEGIEEEEESEMLPDYYNVMSGIPDIPEQLQWVEDSEGNVVDASEKFLRILPKGMFTAPPSKLGQKMDANIRQMQETRKVCSKIGIVRQMQVQTQMYQNQFQKYQPEPFVEQDVPPHVMNDDGPVISSHVCRAALQRSVAKVFYHTGFEEYQPSALDAVTDIAVDFFHKIGMTLKAYMESPKVPVHTSTVNTAPTSFRNPRTAEEIILHTLSAVGTDVETLQSYVKDDMERLGSKLGIIHERYRSHLAELLRPAFNDGGGDGSAAFNDGSEQFIGGDFAEDIDEDFFGFKELGLDKEFGLASLSVPLHLLQNRMFTAHQSQNIDSAQTVSTPFPPPAPYPRVNMENIQTEIGLIQPYFIDKLRTNGDEPLVEDLDLPPKQRPTIQRPRVPASGKIPSQPGLHVSPKKRPVPQSFVTNGQQGGQEPNKKKQKKNNGPIPDAGPENGDQSPSASRKASFAYVKGPEDSSLSKDRSDGKSAVSGGMLSPESINAQA